MPSLKVESTETSRDFPGGPVVKTLNFQCRQCGFSTWSGNWNPIYHTTRPKKIWRYPLGLWQCWTVISVFPWCYWSFFLSNSKECSFSSCFFTTLPRKQLLLIWGMPGILFQAEIHWIPVSEALWRPFIPCIWFTLSISLYCCADREIGPFCV